MGGNQTSIFGSGDLDLEAMDMDVMVITFIKKSQFRNKFSLVSNSDLDRDATYRNMVITSIDA